MLESEFINFSLFDSYQWAYIEFWVDYSADLDEVERFVSEAALASDAYADYEHPRMWLMETGLDAVKCWGAAWADTPALAWKLKHDMRRGLIPKLAERGWAPRPHRVRYEISDSAGPDLSVR